MLKSKVGINAGKIWTSLEGGCQKEVKELKKETKLTDKDLYLALGWLAREEKVVLEESEKSLLVKLA